MRRIERAARAFERGRVGPLLRRVPAWRGTLTLNYHRIGVPDERGFEREIWSADVATFERHAALLAAHFDVVGPDALAAADGHRGRRVLITFDDGYRDNFELALPILERHGLTAAFFVVPDFIDHPRAAWWDEIAWIVNHAGGDRLSLRESGVEELPLRDAAERQHAATLLADLYKQLPGASGEGFLDRLGSVAGCGRCPPELARSDWMTWDQVRALARAGMAIGGHSLTHPVLARLPRDEQEREIAGCAARLREELGEPMTLFSYPVGLEGTWNADTRSLLAAAGVRLAFAFEGGYLPRGAVLDRLAVPRAGVSPGMSYEWFAGMVTLPQVFARW